MSPISAAFRGVVKAADATTAAAGAIGGAAINGVVGGLQGTASGVRSGLSSGSHSPAAAALTIGAIGAAGLVEWPLLVAVGGTALVVHQLNRRSTENEVTPTKREPAPARSARAVAQPRKTAARKATKATRQPAGSARKTTPRKTAAARRVATK